jgi:hypothetical protein
MKKEMIWQLEQLQYLSKYVKDSGLEELSHFSTNVSFSADSRKSIHYALGIVKIGIVFLDNFIILFPSFPDL